MNQSSSPGAFPQAEGNTKEDAQNTIMITHITQK